MNPTPALPFRTQAKTLLLREWMQHRFGWAMMILVPLVIAALTIPVAQFSPAAEGEGPEPQAIPLIVALAGVLGSAGVLATVAVIASLIFAVTSTRRDHGDRSVEFWLSLPVPHSAALGVPLGVHLLVVPTLAILAGWVLGHAISLLVAMRLGVVGEWLALPWGGLLLGTLSIAVRMAVGLMLSALWFAPLLLMVVLAYALLRLWGLIALAALFVVGAVAEARFGIRTFGAWLEAMAEGVTTAFPGGPSHGLNITAETLPEDLLRMPSLLVTDVLHSVAALASPVFAGGLLVAAALFYALVVWRQRGAGAS